ncbi:MAG: diguanylate cyclase [Clostridiales Family XIII bacterium]|nr:diguanylate cyclase [Clostridiales Family XIII bacterium]
MLIALTCVVAIAGYTLFYAESSAKNWMVVMLVSTIFLLTGYLLELTSANVDEAFTAVKIVYFGNAFVCTWAFFFIADYCEVRLNLFLVRIPAILISSFIVIAMWTTKATKLIYVEYWFDQSAANSLKFVPGVMYYASHLYPIVLVCASVAIIFSTKRKWVKHFKSRLNLLLGVIAIPFLGEMVYVVMEVTGNNVYNIYLTPYTFFIMDVVLFFVVVRYDIIGITTAANKQVMDHISEAFVLLDHERRLVSVNNVAKYIFPELTATQRGECIDNIESWPDALRQGFEEKANYSIEFETELGLPGGGIEKRYYESEISELSPMYMLGRKAWAILIRDVTRNRDIIMQLEEYANMDALTGIYNRRYFRELASKQVSRADRFGKAYHILMCDLDKFKMVNDTYGHAAGDVVLKEIARTIMESVREYDIVARFGGEEFVVFVSDEGREGAEIVAERIRKSTEALSISYGAISLSITISIGIAEGREGLSFDETIEHADVALYRAKKKRNMIVYYGDDK